MKNDNNVINHPAKHSLRQSLLRAIDGLDKNLSPRRHEDTKGYIMKKQTNLLTIIAVIMAGQLVVTVLQV